MTSRPGLRILLLCEGDAETWDSWSGSTKSLVDHLRSAGHHVSCGNVELHGVQRWLVGARAFAFRRRRWWVRYHLGGPGFRTRSRRARLLVAEHADRIDVILQVGATFAVRPPSGVTLALYCDSNIELARLGSTSGHSEASSLTERETNGIRAREATVYSEASLIFTMSDLLRATFLESFGIPASRVVTVHAGPNLQGDDEPVPVARSATVDPVVLFVGRAFHRKGGDLLVRSFREVRAMLPDARLIIVGPEVMPEECCSEPGIELLGFINKQTAEGRRRLADAYSRARVFCLPTRFEPFGVVYLEAMHHGLPCIGPRAWAIPEIIEDGVTGLLVSPEDPKDLARALHRLLVDPELASAMGMAGQKRLFRQFTWRGVASKIGDVLRTLHDGPRADSVSAGDFVHVPRGPR